MRKITLAAIIATMISTPMNVSAQQRVSNLSEHCFGITPQQTIGMEAQNTSPEKFIKRHSNVSAAINGPYFGGRDPKNYKTEGVAYLADGHQFADGNLGKVRGYFTVSRDGKSIKVTQNLDGKLTDYWLVIGTHPLLVADGKVSIQSQESRYNGTEYRSAIGNKSSNVCFAVSEDMVTMNEWAERLQKVGYAGAINLDGGPISQMVFRQNGQIKIKGRGTQNTRLIIFEYKR